MLDRHSSSRKKHNTKSSITPAPPTQPTPCSPKVPPHTTSFLTYFRPLLLLFERTGRPRRLRHSPPRSPTSRLRLVKPLCQPTHSDRLYHDRLLSPLSAQQE